MLGLLSAATINHLLKAAPWALERLCPHAGNIIAVKIGPIAMRLAIEANGELRSDASDANADVSIELKPALFMRTLVEGSRALSNADVTGDTALAQTLAYIAQNLRWDYEEDLSEVVGDVAAHRIGSTARSARDCAKQSTESMMQMSKDFWTEERPTIAKSDDVASFVASVDELRDATARLEKRIELLTKARRN